MIYDDVRILFSGDINIKGGEHILEYSVVASKIDPHVFKIPHHGSHKFHFPFLEAIRPQVSVISSRDSPNHGHLRANFIRVVGMASRFKVPLVFSTEIAATFIDAHEIDLSNVVPPAR